MTLRSRLIFAGQTASLAGIWGLLAGVIYWLSNSLRLAFELHDLPSATVVITIVAMGVFITLVGVLTYVFVGLQRGGRKTEPAPAAKEGK